MPKLARIPFLPDQASGMEELAGASPLASNVIVDRRGAVRRRPGIVTHSLGPAGALNSDGIHGLFATSSGEVFALGGEVPGGTMGLYRLLAGAYENLLVDPEAAFTAADRPTWAETEGMVVFTTGGRVMQRILLSDRSVVPLPGLPPRATHVCCHNSRLLANDTSRGNTTKVWYTGQSLGDVTAGQEQWGAQNTLAYGKSGYVTAEARSDPVVAVAENSSQVFVFGSTSLQVYSTDASLVYSSASVREFGCAAPYSVIKDDQSFAWLDDKRRFVSTDGRQVSILSDVIKGTLDDMSRVDDCFGYRVMVGHADMLVWTFPTAGVTLAYQRGGGWSTWTSWDETGSGYAPMSITAHTIVPGTNENLVGTSAGRIGELSLSAQTDFGTVIPAVIRTGHLDRDVDLRKACHAVRLTMRRGQTASTTEPKIAVRYRDEDDVWSNPIHVGLGLTGDRHIVKEIRSLGTYRRRQWEFSFHGTDELVLASATEEYDILGN